MMYTVYDANGHVLAEKVDAQSAAIEMLTDDGYEYRTEQNEDGYWDLYVTRKSRNAYGGNGGYVKWFGVCCADSEDAIWQAVVDHGEYNGCYVKMVAG